MIVMGGVIAWLLVVYGAVRMALGFYIAFTFENSAERAAAAARYLAGINSGEAIDEGAVRLIAGVVIGLLVIIAKNGATAKET